MAKKVEAYIKLQVPAGQANPSPPVGPALGQHGVNIMEFCKAFNAETQGTEPGLPIPVVITVYSDRSFTFIKKTPPASCCCVRLPRSRRAPDAQHQQGWQGKPCSVGRRATQKWPDLTAADMDAAVRTIAGSARSAGIDVEGLTNGQAIQARTRIQGKS